MSCNIPDKERNNRSLAERAALKRTGIVEAPVLGRMEPMRKPTKHPPRFVSGCWMVSVGRSDGADAGTARSPGSTCPRDRAKPVSTRPPYAVDARATG
jgi:hypothetical protein